MSATSAKFYSFIEAAMEKKHDLGADTLRFLFTNTAPTLTWAQKSDVTGEISSGGGYTAGTGPSAGTVSSSSQSSGNYALILTPDPFSFSASGANVGPFRYMILYNDTSTNDLLIGYWDLGASNTIVDGATFELDYSVSGILTAA